MKKYFHNYNFFKINNLSDVEIDYQLIEVNDLPLLPGKEQLFEENLNKLALKISSDISGPAAVVKQHGKPCIAIPAAKQLKAFRHQLTPFTATLKPQDEIQTLQLSHLLDGTISIGQQFLDFGIKKHLSRKPSLWRLSSRNFFLRTPVNTKTESLIDVYGGFVYNLIQLEDGNWHICLDVTYKYANRAYLSDIVTLQNKADLEQHFANQRCLYQFGDNWYQIQILGFGKKISEQTFTDYNGSVHTIYDYTLKHAPSRHINLQKHLDPGSVSIIYKYPNRSMTERYGAACLSKLLYKNDHADVKSLHSYSIKNPDIRFKHIINNIKRNFSGITIDGQEIEVSPVPLKKKARSFLIPELKFRNNQILDVRTLINSETSSLSDYGRIRKKLLLQNGVLKNTTFDNQYLVLPESVDKTMAYAIKRDLDEQMKKLASKFPGYIPVPYQAKNNISAYEQIQLIKKALSGQTVSNGCVLLILPDYHNDNGDYLKNLHDIFKKKYYPSLKFQCALQSNITSFYKSYTVSNGEIEYRVSHDQMRFFRSYTFYLCLQMLLLNRKWLYALKEPLNYDIYVGVDIHERYVGFCFFYKNGERIVFEKEKIAKKAGSGRYEKISKKIITDKILSRLKEDIQQNMIQPESIILLRDGRSFDEDIQALKVVIKNLSKEGLIDKHQLKWGVVDLYKSSMLPFRMASEAGGWERLQNARIGSYETFTDTEGAVLTTGYPFKFPGTAQPLQIKIAAGNIELIKVLQDVFAQSLLAFSAPEKSSSLPITIKLNDIMLEPLALTLEEADLKFSETDEDEPDYANFDDINY